MGKQEMGKDGVGKKLWGRGRVGKEKMGKKDGPEPVMVREALCPAVHIKGT